MNKKGFTLIELLIVVAIIAILAAIAIPNMLEAQTRARVARLKADMRTVVTALESYNVDRNKYIPAFSPEWLPQPNGFAAQSLALKTFPPAAHNTWTDPGFRLTTPVAYITS